MILAPLKFTVPEAVKLVKVAAPAALAPIVVPSILPPSVSYTHLTLPTKRIV